MPESGVDLIKLFGSVAEALDKEKDALNEADSYNHDHGDNMVQSFKVITAALEQKQGASPAEQLAFAGEALKQSSSSGSAQTYSQGLSRAAEKLRGQPAVTGENAMSLVQALLSGGEEPTVEAPGLGLVQALLDGGGDQAPETAELKGKKSSKTPLETLLSAGSAYMEAKADGDTALEALMKAYTAGTQTKKPSQKIVGGTLIEVISNMLGGEETETKKPASKPKKPASKPAAKPKKPAAKPASKPKKPAAKPKKPATKPAARPKKPATKPAAKPKPETSARPKPKPAAKPKPATKPSIKPKPAAKPKPKPKS